MHFTKLQAEDQSIVHHLPLRGGAPDTQRKRAAETKTALIEAARKSFVEKGFALTGTNDIVEGAEVTRGALYHHFANKEDLFEAVFLQLTEELDQTARIRVASAPDDLWERVCTAFESHLDLIATSRAYPQVLLLDGPAVLGWSRCRELQSRFIATYLTQALETLMQKSLIER